MRAYAIVWQYDIHPAARNEFERAYGPDGAWATLFRASPDYLATRLLRDTALPDRYVTLDPWRAEAAFAAFVADRRAADYCALDRRCDALTAAEARLGTFWTTAETGHGPPE